MLILIRAFVVVTNFNKLFRNKSKECKGAIQAINNRQASRNVKDLLAYDPVYRHIILYKADELGRIRLSALRIKG